MKKIIITVIFLIFNSFALSQVNVSMPTSLTGPSGAEIEVPLNVSDLTNKDVISYQFKITFNNTVLNALDVITTGTISAASGWSVLPNISTPGEMTIGAFGSNALSGSGVLVKLKFRVVGSSGTNTNLTFSSFIFNSGTPSTVTTNGSFSVTAPEQPILYVTPDNREVPAIAGTTSFNISNSGTGTMNWSASITGGSSWLSITSGGTGVNTGTIIINYSANSASSSRIGKILITAPGASGSPKEVTITQEGNTSTNTMIISLPINTSAANGNDVEIPITTSDLTNKDVISYQFKITFNDTILNALDVITIGTVSAASGWTVLPNIFTPGEMTIGGFGSNALSGSGVLVKLKFRVVGSGGTSTNLNFSSFIFNSGTPSAVTTNGSFSVTIPEQPILYVTPDNREVPATTGNTSFSISNSGTGTMNWSATITDGSSWLSITSGGTGVNGGTVNLNYAANSASSSRIGKILITALGASGSPKEVTITQSEVKITIPIPPSINLQLNGNTINPLNEIIRWNSSINATKYRVQISNDSNFINIVKDITITDTTLTFTDLEGGTTYYLRISASNSLGSSAWSNTFMFTTSIISISKPVLLLPLNNAPNQPTSITLKWNSVKNASSYSLMLSKDSDFAIIQREFSGITDTSKSITGLDNNTTYFWKTNAKSLSLESEWSEIWRFTIFDRPPSSFTLITPKDNAIIDITYPTNPLTFTWNKSKDPDINDIVKYSLYIIIPDFNITKTDLSDTSITLDIMQFLKTSTNYRWYVSATDGKELVNSTSTYYFSTSGNTIGIRDGDKNITTTYRLYQNYPNPFNPSTNISFELPVSSFTRLSIFDILGKEIFVLINEPLSLGMHSVEFNAGNLQSGIYYYKLQTAKFISIKKLLLLK